MSEQWLIWSNEHLAFWGPNYSGYTQIISKAGRYSEEEARAICKDANEYLPAGSEPNEVMVLAPEAQAEKDTSEIYANGFEAGYKVCYDKQAARIAALEAAFHELRDAVWLAQNEYASASPHSPFVRTLEETRELANKLRDERPAKTGLSELTKIG